MLYSIIEQPIPEGFGRHPVFWKVVISACVIGAFMGVAAVGVINCANEIPKIWIDNGNFDEMEDFDYYHGSKVWILVTTGMGLVVGLLRWVSKYPEDLPGFFKEVNTCHVDPDHVPMTVTISAISLAGGACLGPEACLGNFSGGLGTYVSELLAFEHEEDRKLFVLSSMSAALGCLFPSPFQAVLLINELCAKLPKPFMETAAACTYPAMVGFAVYYTLSEIAYLPHFEPSYKLSENWEFELKHILYGIVIGIISGLLCLLQLIAVGVFKQVFIRIRQRCDATGFISGTIVSPVLGGLILGKFSPAMLHILIHHRHFLNTNYERIGLLYWTLPITVGDGNLVSPALLKQTLIAEAYGLKGIDQHLLIQSGFAKMLALGVSMNCGMIGGFVFPMLTVGVIASVVAHQQQPDIPILLFISCFMAGIPSGICPMPITMMR